MNQSFKFLIKWEGTYIECDELMATHIGMNGDVIPYHRPEAHELLRRCLNELPYPEGHHDPRLIMEIRSYLKRNHEFTGATNVKTNDQT